MHRKILIFAVSAAVTLVVGLIIIAIAFSQSGNADAPQPAPTPVPAPTPRPTPTPTPPPPPILSPPPGMAVSALTGLYISEEAAARRPFAVVYNNESRAMPQAGLSQAAIIYEVLAEGVTTRIVAIFQDFDADIIGPVRSTRHYFTYFALDHGAVMAFHGGSPMGYNALRNRGIAAIDGMQYDGTIFWRDADRRRLRGLEHSSVTSAENLLQVAENRGFDMDVSANLGLFDFFEEDGLTTPNPENIANTVRVPHSGSNVTAFEYNPADGLYYKYIFGAPQMDENTDEQLTAANVIIQITSITHIPGDAEGRRDARLTGSGHGFLATGGTYTRVYWERETFDTPTRWYDEDGNRLTLNRGVTWISVISGEPVFE